MTDSNANNTADLEAAEQEALAAVSTVTGWDMLRQAREDSDVPLESLAAVLKVPVRKLEALEAGELSQGADLTFSRALAASVCRQLRIDAAPILAVWPKSNHAAKKPLHSINDGAPGAATALPPAKREGGGIMWAVVVLALAGIGLWLAIEQTQTSATKRAANQGQRAATQAQPAAAASPVVEAEPSAVSTGDDGAGAAAAVELSTKSNAGVNERVDQAPVALTEEAVPATTVGASGQATETVAEVRKSAAALSASQIANHLLVIQAVEESWVEVTDAFGNRVFTSLMMPGDYTVLDQPSSMSVVVGNASGVVAHTRGQPVDVQGNARGNVSRFDIR